MKSSPPNVIITGVRTEVCVDATAKRAFGENYDVVIAEDLVATIDSLTDDHKMVINNFNHGWGFVLPSTEILQKLSR